jgi:hypothetical protein
MEWKMLVYIYFMDIWNILRPFGTFNGSLVYFEVTRYMFFPVLVCCTKNNLATLVVVVGRWSGSWCKYSLQ